MKKKFMFLAVAALFLSGGVFTAMQLTNKEKVSDLTLANIEAMTIGGDDDDDAITDLPCSGLGSGCLFTARLGDGTLQTVTSTTMKQ